jgi:NAD(P)-dependent dehydrogenase (short-subunit alcohol dehydrogenase family)
MVFPRGEGGGHLEGLGTSLAGDGFGMMRFLNGTMTGKRALVTGAGSGIGRASTIALAKAGAVVALVGRTAEGLEEVVNEIGGVGAGHLVLQADVSEESAMAEIYQEMSRSWDSLDVVVANAGINGVWASLDQLKVEEWDETMAVNLRGTFLTVKLALPYLRKNGGSVIVISSVNGTRMFSNTGATAYSCSKAAQLAFTKMAALELADERIRVNVICPGAIGTNIDSSTERRDLDSLRLPVEYPEGEVPLTGGKAGSAEAVARTVWFLASDASNHVSGTEIYVDGAQSLLQC